MTVPTESIRFIAGLALVSMVCAVAVPGKVWAQSAETTEEPAEAADGTSEAAEAPPEAAGETTEEAAYTDEELDEIVAPVALYPDALLTQVFVASTYPLEVVKAARWVEENAEMAEDDRADATLAEGWDPSVAVLAAGFPSVITRMADEIDWTETLGDALLAQSDAVLDATQRMRARADAVGNLETNSVQNVTVEDDQITIEPADPEVVYVPTYDTQQVYTTSASAAPVVVAPDDDSYDDGDLLLTGILAFGAGMLVNEIFDDDDDWNGYWGPGYRPVNWGGGGFYPRPGFNNNDVNINIDNDRVNIGNDGRWEPSGRQKREAENKIADRKGVTLDRPARGGAAAKPAKSDRDLLKRKLGDGGQGLSKVKDRPALKKAGGGKATAFSGHGGKLGKAKKATDRGKLSVGKSDRPRATGTARPANQKPKLNRSSGGKGGAFSRKGGGKKARAAQSRGGASKKKLGRRG